jgi:hypothetical protein
MSMQKSNPFLIKQSGSKGDTGVDWIMRRASGSVFESRSLR